MGLIFINNKNHSFVDSQFRRSESDLLFSTLLRGQVCLIYLKRSVGAVDFLTNFIDLRAMLVSKRSVGAILKINTFFSEIVSPVVSQSNRSTDV
jgi:hypothetical protein